MNEKDEGPAPFKPYVIRAMVDWCEDNGLRPYILVQADRGTVVPSEFVKEGRITLSLASEAVHNARLGNEAFEFEARFGEAVRSLYIPVRSIIAVFPAEMPERGMGFPYEEPAPEEASGDKGGGAPFVIQKVK